MPAPCASNAEASEPFLVKLISMVIYIVNENGNVVSFDSETGKGDDGRMYFVRGAFVERRTFDEVEQAWLVEDVYDLHETNPFEDTSPGDVTEMEQAPT